MKLKKIICLLTLWMFCVLSTNAYATWTGQQSLYRVYAATAYLYVQTSPNNALINPSGCQRSSNYILPDDNKFFQEQLKMLLTALAAGKKVSLDISGCLGTYPTIKKVMIYQ